MVFPIVWTYLNHLNSIYTDLGITSGTRGEIFERLAGETLKLLMIFIFQPSFLRGY